MTEDSRNEPLRIRAACSGDEEGILNIFQAVVSTGDTYVFSPTTTREAAAEYWLNEDSRCFVAILKGEVVGTYIVKDNQPGLGSHVANASFMVLPSAHGRAIGRQMGEHALIVAKGLGYRAMQFNFVVSSNIAAVRLWLSLGFKIVGMIPQAFKHSQLGFTDVYVMHKAL